MMQILQRMADPGESLEGEGEGIVDPDEEVDELDSRLQSLDIGELVL